MWIRAVMVCTAVSTAAVVTASGQRVSLDFGGGTLYKFVEAVQAKLPNANIAVDGDTVGNTLLPKVKLPRSGLPQLLQWVTSTSAARSRGISLQPRSAGDSGEVFLFTLAQAPLPPQQPGEPSISSKDYYIEPLEKSPKWADTVLLAVQTKFEKHGSKTGRATYDARTRLLNVTGTRIDIQDADQTIDTLVRGRQTEAALPQLQAALGKLSTSVDSLRVRVTALERIPTKP